MAKTRETESIGNKPPVDNVVSGQKPPNVDKKKSKTVTVTFRENRKFDLHVGREMVTFMGRESKKIPASWLNHQGFIQVRKYFVVKGV